MPAAFFISIGFHPLGAIALFFGITSFLLRQTQEMMIDSRTFTSTCS
ncbi:TPA: hypothetical protein ACOEHO_001073 [Enterobacter ludwigii]|nr:hypothetical protein [Enterobacter ludwigii]